MLHRNPNVFRVLSCISALLGLSVLGACTVHPPAATYVGDTELGSVAKLPDGWERYETSTVVATQMPETGGAVPLGLLVIGFSATPVDPQQLFTDTEQPTGWLLRRPLRPGEDAITAKRDSVFPISRGLVGGSVIITATPEVFERDGFSGEQLTYDVKRTEGTVRVRVAGVRDPVTDRLYVLAVGCSIECQTNNRESVDRIYGNWKVYG